MLVRRLDVLHLHLSPHGIEEQWHNEGSRKRVKRIPSKTE